MPWNGFEPEIGDMFEILQATDGIVGTFDEIFVDPFFLDLGIGFELSYDNGIASLLAVAAGIAGDFDFAVDVDGSDFLAWQRDTSVVDLADWQANYGQSALAATNSVAVPEPTTLGQFFMAGLVCTARQRCR